MYVNLVYLDKVLDKSNEQFICQRTAKLAPFANLYNRRKDNLQSKKSRKKNNNKHKKIK